MKNKFILFLMAMAFVLIPLETIYISATEETDEVEDTQTTDAETTDNEAEDEFTPAQTRGEGYEDWHVGNPLLREFYGGYQRDGKFYLVRLSDKRAFIATQLKVTWRNGGGVNKNYYVPEIGGSILETNAYYVREYIDVNETLTLTRNAEVYSHPFNVNAFRKNETLASGTYKVSKISLEMIEVEKTDGTKVWISPQYKPNDVFLSTNYGKFVGSKDALSVNNIRGVPIHKRIMPVREDKRTGIAMKPQYITIHNTGNSGAGANAAAHANIQINDSRTWISWHYTVDNKEIYQSMPINEVAYHAGDGTNIGNAATIAIEICENSDGNYAIAEKNAAYLTARLLYENNLDAGAIRQHKDWSGKNCPSNIIAATKGSLGWVSFKAVVKTEYDKIVAENQVIEEEKGDNQISTQLQDVLSKSNYTFNGGFVYGFKEGSTLQSVLDTLKVSEPSLTMEVKKDSNNVNLNTVVSTGQVATIKIGSESAKVILVVKGDVNGDGKISAMDYVLVKNHILQIKKLTNIQSAGANVNKDEKISALDYVAIKNHILNISKINQLT